MLLNLRCFIGVERFIDNLIDLFLESQVPTLPPRLNPTESSDTIKYNRLIESFIVDVLI